MELFDLTIPSRLDFSHIKLVQKPNFKILYIKKKTILPPAYAIRKAN